MQYGIRKQKTLPDVITDSYLHSMMMAGIVAAHETTANATANAMKLLLQHPDAWRDICDDPSLIPNAVEECLRHNGSVAAWRRLATKDVTIGGVAVPAGSKLLIVTSSANHDEARFADADLFDIAGRMRAISSRSATGRISAWARISRAWRCRSSSRNSRAVCRI